MVNHYAEAKKTQTHLLRTFGSIRIIAGYIF